MKAIELLISIYYRLLVEIWTIKSADENWELKNVKCEYIDEFWRYPVLPTLQSNKFWDEWISIDNYWKPSKEGYLGHLMRNEKHKFLQSKVQSKDTEAQAKLRYTGWKTSRIRQDTGMKQTYYMLLNNIENYHSYYEIHHKKI